METIQIPPTLTEVEFENLLRDCHRVRYKSTGTVQFNFSLTSFVSSFAMIEFILLCEQLEREWGKHISLYLSNSPKLPSCMYVLSRLGFFDSLPTSVTFYPFKPKLKKSTKGKNQAILEVTKVPTENDAGHVVDLVYKAVSKNTPYESTQIKDICIMVSEILQNIFYHSQSKRAGLIAIQNYHTQHYMQMVIADAGIGIPETIRSAPEYIDKNLSDVDTILESIKKGVSREGKIAGRGEGLTRCVQLAEKHHARLFIRSNTGWASVTLHKGRGKAGMGELLAGTQIFVNFPSI